MSGTKGSRQGGNFIMEDPRTIFYVPDDRQVIGYFEWEGPLGPHHFEGLWKNPEGKVAVISEFQYDATQKRFAGYWTLLLSENMPTGVWTLEARIDGEVAGTHTFQIVARSRPPDAAPAARLLTPSEIYQRALAATIFIEKLGPGGELLATGSGFVLGKKTVITAFQTIDGASNLRLVFPSGRSVETREVVAWNRWQDWAVLRVEAEGVPQLERAKPDSWAVGDRCFFLELASEGNRVIADLNITGKNTFSRAGERLNLSFAPSQQAVGSPLLTEFGQVIGVIGGSLVPGASSLEALRFTLSTPIRGTTGLIRGGLAVPIALIPSQAEDGQPTSLGELAVKGQFLPPLTANKHVGYGTLARGLERKGNPPWPVNSGDEFSRRDVNISAFVMWEPKEKHKGLGYIRVYDLDNRLLGEGKAMKINFHPGTPYICSWELGVAGLAPGIYRVDILLDSNPAWRMFFRITE